MIYNYKFESLRCKAASYYLMNYAYAAVVNAAGFFFFLSIPLYTITGYSYSYVLYIYIVIATTTSQPPE